MTGQGFSLEFLLDTAKMDEKESESFKACNTNKEVHLCFLRDGQVQHDPSSAPIQAIQCLDQHMASPVSELQQGHGATMAGGLGGVDL